MENKVELRRSKRLKAKQDAETAWPNLPYELLLRILSIVSLMDRVLNVAAVCRSWRAVVSDPFLSPQKLDISEFRHQLNHNLPVARQRAILRLIFVRGINVALTSLKTLVFDSSFPWKNNHLLHASSRCPNVRELVLPCELRNITKEGLTEAFKQWTQLESLALGCRDGEINIIKIAGPNCPNLRVLNICCPSSYMKMAADIISGMPRLKVIKVRSRFLPIWLARAIHKLKSGLLELEEISVSMEDNLTYKHTRTSSDWVPHTGYLED